MSLKIEGNQLDKAIKEIAEKIRINSLKSMRSVFESKLIPRILDNIMKIYDRELVGKEPGFDPARPSEARNAFRSQILTEMTSGLSVSNNSIFLSAGDPDILGYNKNISSKYIKSIGKNPGFFDWLILYLEGFIGEYAFITEETYTKFFEAKKVTRKALDKFSTWGWFGEGFMILKKVYIKQGLHKVIPFESVRHPFSGVKPTKLFENALSGINMKEIFGEAIKRGIGK